MYSGVGAAHLPASISWMYEPIKACRATVPLQGPSQKHQAIAVGAKARALDGKRVG